MPESLICSNAQATLKEVILLKTAYIECYAEAAATQDPSRVHGLIGPLKEKIRVLKELTWRVDAEKIFHLQEQYQKQVSFLVRADLIESKKELDASGKEQTVVFFRGIDEKEYPLPSFEEIFKHVFEKSEILKEKADQGFKKLLIVPFGMRLEQILARLERAMNNGKIIPRMSFQLDIASISKRLACGDVDGIIRYDPERMDDEVRGKTKSQLLDEQNQEGLWKRGWSIILLQEADDGVGFRGIPRVGAGGQMGTMKVRKDIETKKTPTQYLDETQRTMTDPTSSYFAESGMGPEEWIFALTQHMEATAKPQEGTVASIDNYFDTVNSMAILTGCYLCFDSPEKSNRALSVGFNFSTGIEFYEPVVDQAEYVTGVRTAVRI